MTTYTVFIGGWDDPDDPDWVVERVSGLSWEQAREKLAAHFRLFAYDECDPCQQRGKDALAALDIAAPGNFTDTVDGNDCMIIEEPTTVGQ